MHDSHTIAEIIIERFCLPQEVMQTFFTSYFSFYLVGMKGKIISCIFWILCITDIVTNTFNIAVLHYAVKPLLIPCLIYLFINETKHTKVTSSPLLITGLLFCWLGDVLLMFESSYPIFFILGLASFLGGHLFYIFYFSKLPSQPKKMRERNLLILLPVAVYVLILLYKLYPSLGDLKIPVTVYAIVLAAMLSMALWKSKKTDFTTGLLFIVGATSFVLSDSLLAINKFYHPFSQSVFFIMFTYSVAQYLIVMGGIRVNRNTGMINHSVE